MVPDPATPRPATRPPGARVAFALLAAGLIAVVGFVTWQATQRAPRSADTPGVVAERGVITLAVEGMSCVGCAGTVETTLAAVPGVAQVKVDYEHRLATIRLADESLEPSVLIAALDQAGYPSSPAAPLASAK